jgi:predicted nucleic acid-binding protein
MLLDTNAISAWAEQDAGVLGVLRGDRLWFLPGIALGEYRFGLIKSRRREVLETWLNEIEESCPPRNHPDLCFPGYSEFLFSNFEFPP